jgi:hypothetical protein
MTAYLRYVVNAGSYFVNAGKDYIWPAQVLAQVADAFHENLLRFSWTSLSQQECVDKCIDSIKQTLQPSDYQLLDAGKQTIDAHIGNFIKAVEGTSRITTDQREALKIAFKSSLVQTIVKKWAEAAAKSFYPIPSITNENERVIAAQKWTHQLYDGIDYLAKCEDQSGSSLFYLQKIQEVIVQELCTYYHNETQRQSEAVLKRFEKNPVAFAKEMEHSFNKQDPNNEYVKLINDTANALVIHWPELETNCELMKKCIWHGYTLRQAKISMLDSSNSLTLFAETFKKKE